MQARFGGFHRKIGRYWVVRSYVDGAWLYYMGHTGWESQGSACSVDASEAAQFLCEKTARLAAEIIGGERTAWRVEEHFFAAAAVC